MKDYLRLRPDLVLVGMACLLFAVEPVQGYLFGGDLSKAGTNLIAIAFIFAMTAISFVAPNYRRNLLNTSNIFIVVVSLHTLTYIVISGSLNDAVRYDIFALLRSIVLGYLLYNFCRAIPYENREPTLKRIALIVWWTVCITILAGNLSGRGLYTYADHSSGYKFFYPSLNELSFVFFSSFLILLATNQNNTRKAIYTLLTLLTFLVIGNKSFIALFSISLTAYFFLSRGAIARTTILLILCAILIALASTNIAETLIDKFFALVIYILTEYSSGSSKLLLKLSYLDPFSALVSERDKLLSIAADIYRTNYGLLETLFGLGYSNYGSIYGIARGSGTFSYSEMDPVDIFMSYGILGLFITFYIALSIYSERNEISNRLYMLRRILVILFFSTGALTGHLYLMGFPVFFFACYAGLCASPYRRLGLA
ncbi:hypothetical protein C662_14711 [Thauera sp. 28]|uniref:hypothetical protein n=1 Tax=Thauera sp. 28 TaxID=303682 RepID=UPI0002CF1D0B|nr:hypothetical protein [Thauera sp. 28]ENO91837.1 hypothetical protein C662_14711 [Thauera sp. 28]